MCFFSFSFLRKPLFLFIKSLLLFNKIFFESFSETSLLFLLIILLLTFEFILLFIFCKLFSTLIKLIDDNKLGLILFLAFLVVKHFLISFLLLKIFILFIFSIISLFLSSIIITFLLILLFILLFIFLILPLELFLNIFKLF